MRIIRAYTWRKKNNAIFYSEDNLVICTFVHLAPHKEYSRA